MSGSRVVQSGSTSAPVSRAVALHEAAFGQAPTHGSTAPGRVNLIGEHIDYCGGFVMPIAINRRTAVVGRVTSTPGLRIVSEARPGEVREAAIADSPAVSGWASYVAGVVAILHRRGMAPGPGCDVAVASDVPVGAGLSSSAAVEVAVTRCVLAMTGQALPPLEVAAVARAAEHEFAKVPCGLMDQHISVFGRAGHALLLDCHDGTHVEVPIPSSVAVIVADTGVKHSLASGEYAARRASCERLLAAVRRRGSAAASLRHCSPAELSDLPASEEDRKRGRHVAGECQRTQAFAAALASGDLAACGELMHASHESLRTLYEVSCPELDVLAAAARGLRGVYGARMTGGGFGGCIVALAEASESHRVVEALLTHGATQAFATPACDGARVESLR